MLIAVGKYVSTFASGFRRGARLRGGGREQRGRLVQQVHREARAEDRREDTNEEKLNEYVSLEIGFQSSQRK